MTKRSIFREKALERLASPDNLHELVSVTSSRSWLALLGLAGIVLAIILWSFFGRLPKTVSGQGILIQSGGIAEVTLLGSGIVQSILPKEGDYIRKNDTIAIVAQPELQLQIDNTRDKLQFLKEKRQKIVRFNLDSEELQSLYTQKYTLEEKHEEAQKQKRKLEEILNNEQTQLEQGVSTKEKVNRARLRYLRAQRTTMVFDKQLQSLNLKLSAYRSPENTELEEIASEIREVKTTLEELNFRLSISAYVKSNYEGRVIELMAKTGQLLEIGDPVVSIEISNQQASALEVIIYVPPEDGKKVEQGMEVQIAPSTIKIEEYGYLLGEVSKVSEYPATRYGMRRVLGNADLAQTFSQDAAPIAIRVKLKKNPKTKNFRWTSQKGSEVEVKAGTLCSANVVVSEQSPISLMLPFLR